MFLTALGIGGAIGALGAGIYNSWRQGQENETAREREDNAIQRRVQDLQKAGLSPTLAAGSGASSAQMTAPQVSGIDKALNVASDIMALKQGKANISHTNAQTELSKMQATSELFHQGVMQSQKNGMDLQNAWIDSDMASKLKLRGLQGDKLSSEIGQITANTALLKAKTAYEQVNKDYLMTAIDNAKIQRDLNNFNLTTAGIRLYNDTYAVNKGALGKLFGDFRQPFSGFDIRHAIKNIDNSWYWENKK